MITKKVAEISARPALIGLPKGIYMKKGTDGK